MTIISLIAVFISVLHFQSPSETFKNMSSQQTTCLAQVIFFEARGEPRLGQIAVAQVVLNRVKSRQMSICAVVHEKGQFDFITYGHGSIKDKDSWNRAVQIATLGQFGMLNNPIGDATMFRSTNGWNNNQYTKIATIGHQCFYTFHYMKHVHNKKVDRNKYRRFIRK
jgi:spore germination cell wall hydrolase CwlJ-like protein